jgi:hypothetical protein
VRGEWWSVEMVLVLFSCWKKRYSRYSQAFKQVQVSRAHE